MSRSFVNLLALFLLLSSSASAQIVIDDFEDILDWSGLESDGTIVKEGSFSGLWSNTVATTSVIKHFASPLDFSPYDHFAVWVYSHKANGAQLQLILNSEEIGNITGANYYSTELTIDWVGWRHLRIPLIEFDVTRVPLGWHYINFVKFSSDGWGHDPLADTMLNFDLMEVTNGTVRIVGEDYFWEGTDFVYEYDLKIVNDDALPQTYNFAFSGASSIFAWSVAPDTLTLSGGEDGNSTVTVRIDAGVIASSALLHDERNTLVVWTVVDGLVELLELRATAPLAERAHPALLMCDEDVDRINDWVAEPYSWADNRRQEIIDAANAWPVDYEETYFDDDPLEPLPEGGQWEAWYVCPIHNVGLRFDGPGLNICPVCPVDENIYTGYPYDQVIYARMHRALARSALRLAQAWMLTGDSTYADKAALILLAYAYADADPDAEKGYLNYPIHDIYGHQSPSSGRVMAQTLDESAWLVDITWAYDLIQTSGELNDVEREQIEQGLLREAAALIGRHDTGTTNWQSWHNAAIGGVGFTLDDPRLQSDAWRLGSSFLYQMEASVSGDGFWYEGSWGYHFFALRALTYLAEMARRAGLDPTGGTALLDMFRSPVTFAEPDGMLPPFNDSVLTNVLSEQALYEPAYGWSLDPMLALPLDRTERSLEALFWGAEIVDTSGAEAASQSLIFPDSGYAVMRAGFSRNEPVYVALDYGPHGGWHGHYDKLGFVLYGAGAELAVDAGTHAYSLDIHDDYDRTTVAHNTVVVDATTQQEATGSLRGSLFLPDLSLAQADAGPAYGSAELEREMLVTDRYIIDRFETRALDATSHQYDWLLHAGGLPTLHGLPTTAHSFPPETDGYDYFENVERVDATPPLSLGWDLSEPACGEECSYWVHPAGIVASFEVSSTEAFGGLYSGRMHYDFSEVTGKVIFSFEPLAILPGTEVPDELKISIYGDGSGNELRFRLYDAANERFAYDAGVLDFTGWRSFNLEAPETWSHFDGDSDGIFDPPVAKVSVQIDHAGVPLSDLYVDDIQLVYGAETVGVNDFETDEEHYFHLFIPAETGEGGFELFTGTGPSSWHEDIPFVMVRKVMVDTVFYGLLEPSRTAQAGATLDLLTPTSCATVECRGYRVSHPEYSDSLLWDADFGPGSAIIEMDDGSSTDGMLGYCRREAQSDTFVRMALASGSLLSCEEMPLVETSIPVSRLQVDIIESGTQVEVTAEIDEEAEIRILAPAAIEARLNGAVESFVRDDEYIVIGAPLILSVSLDPEPGCFAVGRGGSIDVTLSSNSAGATIHYTIDGNDPTESDPVYAGPITLVERTRPYAVKARAFQVDWIDSDLAEGVYELKKNSKQCK